MEFGKKTAEFGRICHEKTVVPNHEMHDSTDQRLGTFDSIVADGLAGNLIQRYDGHPSLQVTFL